MPGVVFKSALSDKMTNSGALSAHTFAPAAIRVTVELAAAPPMASHAYQRGSLRKGNATATRFLFANPGRGWSLCRVRR